MIKDRAFKKLKHLCKGYSMFKNGQELESGYKPDYVLCKEKTNQYIIMESENCTSRKAFIGGLVKAAHYIQNDKKGFLIFVITPKDNTKIHSIVNQIETYFTWISDKTNLDKVYVIEASQYFNGETVLPIESKKFNKAAKVIKR